MWPFTHPVIKHPDVKFTLNLWKLRSWLSVCMAKPFCQGPDLEWSGHILFATTKQVEEQPFDFVEKSHSINKPPAIHILQTQVPGLKLWLFSGFVGPASPTAYHILPPRTQCFRVLLKCLQNHLHYFLPLNAVSFTQ